MIISYIIFIEKCIKIDFTAFTRTNRYRGGYSNKKITFNYFLKLHFFTTFAQSIFLIYDIILNHEFWKVSLEKKFEVLSNIWVESNPVFLEIEMAKKQKTPISQRYAQIQKNVKTYKNLFKNEMPGGKVRLKVILNYYIY